MANVSALEALADPTRRRIFDRLRAGPCSVNELVSTVAFTQPAVSQHLRVLKDARLVQVRRLGRQRIYSVNRDGLAELRAYVESLWDEVLGAFEKAAADEAAQAPLSEAEESNHA